MLVVHVTNPLQSSQILPTFNYISLVQTNTLNKVTVTLQVILVAISLIHYYIIGFIACPQAALVTDDVYVSVNNMWFISAITASVPCLKGISHSVKILQNTSMLLNRMSCCRSEFSLFIDGGSSVSRLILENDKLVCSIPFETFFLLRATLHGCAQIYLVK